MLFWEPSKIFELKPVGIKLQILQNKICDDSPAVQLPKRDNGAGAVQGDIHNNDDSQMPLAGMQSDRLCVLDAVNLSEITHQHSREFSRILRANPNK